MKSTEKKKKESYEHDERGQIATDMLRAPENYNGTARNFNHHKDKTKFWVLFELRKCREPALKNKKLLEKLLSVVPKQYASTENAGFLGNTRETDEPVILVELRERAAGKNEKRVFTK